jgi:uncharacterized protein YbjT (DUF2867 family)
VIGITGATGTLGRVVVARAAARGLRAVALLRRPEALPGTAARRFDYGERASWGPALEGLSAVLAVAPPGDPANVAADVIAFLEAARSRSVEHVTFCSARAMVFFDRPLAMHRIETWVAQQSGMSYSILRPSWFMQNFSERWRSDVQRGVLALPAGGGACAWVDAADVADVALATLADPARWNGKILTLCGPEPLTVAEALERVAIFTGVSCRYAPLTPQAWVQVMVERGMPEGAARHQASLLQLLAADTERGVLDDVQRVLGRAPAAFEDFLGRALRR